MPLKEDGCTCRQCLSTFKVDVIVPDDLWKRLGVPEGWLLCGACIMRRIEALGDFGAFELVDIVHT